jgi:HD-like signal output (HDOD) protein
MMVSNIPLAVRRARLLKAVPPFRPVAAQLLNLVSDISQPLGRVVNLLRTDVVLTAEVLRLANSPLLGCRGEIKNMLHALAFLGVERVNSLILTTAMRGLAGPMNRKLARTCWRHNLATATICERIAPSLHIHQERGYVAGLIHDLGRLALMRSAGASCRRRNRPADRRKSALRDGSCRGRPMAPVAMGLPAGTADRRRYA